MYLQQYRAQRTSIHTRYINNRSYDIILIYSLLNFFLSGMIFYTDAWTFSGVGILAMHAFTWKRETSTVCTPV